MTQSDKISYKDEALLALKDWQKEVAADRSLNPTESNAATLRQINLVIQDVEAI